MSDSEELQQHICQQLADTHARFSELMESRMADADVDEVERYFALMSKLVSKLEDADLTLRDIMAEMVAEALPVVMAELAG